MSTLETHIQFTLFNSRDTLTKRIFQRDDGSVGKESASLARGTAQRVDVHGAQGLAHLLDHLAPTQAVAYGVTDRLTANIGPRNYLRPGEISRSRDNFIWPTGPGVLFLDFDGKHDADSIPTLRQALASAMPELDDAPQVWTRSSSAAIFDPATGEASQGGLHCYVIVGDASAIPTIGRQLYDALWMTGHGYHELSQGDNPAALERCLVDASVWQPERLDYAAAPLVEAPLARTAANVIKVANADAEPLNPARIKVLSDAQQAAVSTAKRDSKAKAVASVHRQRKTLLDALPAAQREPLRRRWLSLDRQMLTPDAPIILGNGHTITAGDILANPGQYNGRHCRDPQDPFNDNGNDSQGLIFADEKGCRIFSLAHGGRTFRITAEAPQEAQQAPPETLVLAPEPDTRDIISACYRHRATATANGLEAAASEVGATLDYAVQVWMNHIKHNAQPLHSDARPTQAFDRFADVAGLFSANRESLFTLAKLGSGKTKHLGGQVVKQAQAEGRPVLTVTVLRALTWANADIFSASHYSDSALTLDASHTVSTTLHSMNSPKLAGFLERIEYERGVIVIDEAAAVAGLLFSRDTDGSILASRQRHDIISTLTRLAGAGVQTLMLDGDGTPCAKVLAELMGCRVVTCTEQQHPDPMVAVYPELIVEHDGKNTASTPCHAEIIRLLQAGERVVLPTDSREQAERLHALYAPMAAGGALCIHGSNADGEEQAAFRANPNDQAKRWQLITYSPALSVGVSVTSITPHLFVFARAGSLDAAGLWQLARRFRSAASGLVRFIVGANLCRPQRQRIGLKDIQGDIAHHAHALDLLNNAPELRGMVAAEWQRNLYDANPLHALIGHLGNIGVVTTLAYSNDAKGVDDRKLAREAVRTARIERIATADHMGELEAAQFERNARAVPEDQAKLERNRIEQALALTHDDCEADGSLPATLVEEALYDNLAKRTRRLSLLLASAQGANLETSDDPVPGFVYLKHKNAQARLMLDMLKALETDAGEIIVTAAKARTVADTFRRRIHVAYSDIPRPPTKKASNQSFTRWARDLLHGWGLLSGKGEQTWTRDGERGDRAYTYQIDEHVATFATRLSVSHLAKSDCAGKRLEPAWLSALAGYTCNSGVYNYNAPSVASDAA
ncbi:hypothetical protein [Vreelandella titanicae]|uniref:hypothetical protein n=1 Tax=Vreelandella titanicae TaxID=664683 RepID=UPI004043A1E9